MLKSARLLGLTVVLTLGTATVGMAAGSGAGDSSQSVTGTQLNSPQESSPATGSAATTHPNMANQTYPATVGPTGSTQPDATNPNRSEPAGGGGGKN